MKEREGERERVCVCVCVRERERERRRGYIYHVIGVVGTFIGICSGIVRREGEYRDKFPEEVLLLLIVPEVIPEGKFLISG